MSENNTAFDYSAGFEEPYFDAGQYLVEIDQARVNKHGNPYVKLIVKDSHDDRRINMRYFVNFNLKPREGQDAGKAQAMWRRQFDRVLRALEVTTLTDLTVLEGKQFTLTVWESGYSPLPNARPASQFSKNWDPIAAQNRRNNKKQAATNVVSMPDVNGLKEPDFDMDDDVPF